MEQERYLDNEEEIDIKELLYVLKKRWLLILILPILCAAAAAVMSFFVLKPVYQANVSIIISKDQGSVLTQSDVTMYQNLIKTYTEIAKSSVVAERAANVSGVNATADQLQAALTVSSQTGTQILNMSAVSGQPNQAAKMVEALSDSFLQESKRLLPSGSVEIMDHAKVPQSAVKPNKKLNILIAFAVGLLAAVGAALIMEFMKDTIKTEEDVERYLGVPIIGVIPKHM